MAESLGSAVLDLRADDTKLDRDLKRAQGKSERSIADIGKRIASIGTSMTLGLTAPLTAIGSAAIKMASDAAESANKFDVVMGDSADSVRQSLADLSEIIPLTTGEIEGLAAGVQDFLVPMGVARDQAAGMSVEIVKLAGDLGSFNNVGTAEVLEAMQSALAGSSEPMRRFGVDTREAALKAIALEHGLIAQGEAMDETARAQAVLLAIQKDSTDAMGDAARTANEFANESRFLWRDIRQLGEEIGGVLIPVVTPMIAKARELVAWFQELSPETKQLVVTIGGLAAAIGPVVIAVGGLVAALGPLISVAGPALATLIGGPVGLIALLGGLALSFEPVRKVVFAFIGYLKDRALKVIDGIRESFRKWGETWDWIKEKVGLGSDEIEKSTGVTEAASRAVETHDEWLRMVADRTSDAAAAATENTAAVVAGTTAQQNLTAEVEAFVGLQPALEGGYQGAELALRSWADEMDAAMFTLASFDQQWREFVDGLDDIDIAKNLADEIGDAFEGLDEFDAEFVLDPPVSIPSAGSFMSSIKDLFSGDSALGQGITGALGGLFSGDSVGESITNGLKAGLSMAANAIVPGLGTLMAPLIDGLTNLFSGLFSSIFSKASVGEDLGRDLGLQISAGLMQSIEGTADQIGDIYSAITLRLGDIIRETGVESEQQLMTLIARSRDLFSHIEQGHLSLGQVQSVINDQFAQLLEASQEFGGAGSEQLGELIALAKQFGVTIDQDLIAAYNDLGKVHTETTDTMTSTWSDALKTIGVNSTAFFGERRTEAFEHIKALDINAKLQNKIFEALGREANKTFRQQMRERLAELGLTESEIQETIRASIKQQRKEARQAAREERLEQRQRVLDVREVELQRRSVLRDTMRLAKGWTQELGQSWSDTIRGMLDTANEFEHELVGGSIIPDTVNDSLREFDRLESGFSDRVAGMVGEADTSFNSTAPSGGLTGALDSSAPAGNSISTARMEQLLQELTDQTWQQRREIASLRAAMRDTRGGG